MQLKRPRPLLNLSSGEVLCPRKGAPFASIISVMSCQSLHAQNPIACEGYGCNQYINAQAEMVNITKSLENPTRTRMPGTMNAAKRAT